MKVWRLPAEVDAEQLAPGHAMPYGLTVVARHCLEALRTDFARDVRPGDVIVAGPHFGVGSSREEAASVLVRLGVAAVIAPSFNGLYFRNACNMGLLALTCPQAALLNEGEAVSCDARQARITRADGSVLAVEPIPCFLLDRIEAGGLLPQLKRRAERGLYR
jgi:3-isopropylmalate/(R)-2-methylmalate dehydratase small subunit